MLKLCRRRALTALAAPVAQLDRALASGAKGHRFESCRARIQPSYRQSRLLYWGLALVLLFAPLAAQASEKAPTIGSVSAVSLNEERQFGRLWWRKNYHRYHPVSDYLLQSYAQHLVALLAQGEQIAPYDLQIHILPAKSLNAFAAPGGILGINLGLWYYADSEGEMASVLAHELAHLSQRHFARMVQDARRSTSISVASILAGIGLVIAGNPSAGALAIYGSAGYQYERYLKLSRRLETEADNLAYAYMQRAGFSAQDTLNMFHHMERIVRESPLPEYMSTHPLTSDRLHIARLRAGNAKHATNTRYTDYPFARLRAVSLAGLALPSAPQTKTERDYAKALQLHGKGKHMQAASIMADLAVANPQSSFLFFSSLDSQLKADQAANVVATLIRRHKYSGDSAILHYYLAKGQAMQDNYDAAIASMQKVLAADTEDEEIWRLLANYYARLGKDYEYFRADAVYKTLTGLDGQAGLSMRLAQEAAGDDPILLAELDNMRREFGIAAGQ